MAHYFMNLNVECLVRDGFTHNNFPIANKSSSTNGCRFSSSTLVDDEFYPKTNIVCT